MKAPKNLDQKVIEEFFCPTLLASAPYSLEKEQQIEVKLDQNENPFDWPLAIKDEVLEQLKAASWNRYPDPFAGELNALIGQHLGMPAECILTGPGSNHQITLLFDAIGPNLKGKMVVARPSFALFESQCQYSNIPYETWDLNDDLEYDLKNLPSMPEGSMLVFASPNNPTGASLKREDLIKILEDNPKSLIVADEAYYEFASEGFHDLLEKYPNLIILRTLSKTLGAAGIRIGYILSNKAIIDQLAKRRLPYLLNHFTIIASKVMLSHPDMTDFLKTHIEHVRSERERVYEKLAVWAKEKSHLLKNSEANFLLLKCQKDQDCNAIHEKLRLSGLMVRNISKGPKLAGCLRISLGTKAENDKLIQVISSL